MMSRNEYIYLSEAAAEYYKPRIEKAVELLRHDFPQFKFFVRVSYRGTDGYLLELSNPLTGKKGYREVSDRIGTIFQASTVEEFYNTLGEKFFHSVDGIKWEDLKADLGIPSLPKYNEEKDSPIKKGGLYGMDAYVRKVKKITEDNYLLTFDVRDFLDHRKYSGHFKKPITATVSSDDMKTIRMGSLLKSKFAKGEELQTMHPVTIDLTPVDETFRVDKIYAVKSYSTVYGPTYDKVDISIKQNPKKELTSEGSKERSTYKVKFPHYEEHETSAISIPKAVANYVSIIFNKNACFVFNGKRYNSIALAVSAIREFTNNYENINHAFSCEKKNMKKENPINRKGTSTMKHNKSELPPTVPFEVMDSENLYTMDYTLKKNKSFIEDYILQNSSNLLDVKLSKTPYGSLNIDLVNDKGRPFSITLVADIFTSSVDTEKNNVEALINLIETTLIQNTQSGTKFTKFQNPKEVTLADLQEQEQLILGIIQDLEGNKREVNSARKELARVRSQMKSEFNYSSGVNPNPAPINGLPKIKSRTLITPTGREIDCIGWFNLKNGWEYYVLDAETDDSDTLFCYVMGYECEYGYVSFEEVRPYIMGRAKDRNSLYEIMPPSSDGDGEFEWKDEGHGISENPTSESDEKFVATIKTVGLVKMSHSEVSEIATALKNKGFDSAWNMIETESGWEYEETELPKHLVTIKGNRGIYINQKRSMATKFLIAPMDA